MNKKKLSGRALVIELGRDKTRVAAMTLGSAMPALGKTAVIDTPAGAVDDGAILGMEPLREALRDVLRDPEFKKIRRVVFSLCSTQVISASATLPEVPAKQLQKLLESNMDMYFPVDSRDYHLVWTVVGSSLDEDEKRQLELQLWAVPTAVLARYYSLANSLGLSVAAIDYVGASVAAAFDATFTAPAHRGHSTPAKKPKKQKKAKKGEPEAAASESATATAVMDLTVTRPAGTLCVMADSEHLLMTFVEDGRAVMQRLLLRGGDSGDELTEAEMVIEYYTALGGGRDRPDRLTVCGELAGDEAYLAMLESYLGIPATVWRSGGVSPEWAAVVGASRMSKDFGVPTMDNPGGASSQLGQIWQYVLVIASAAALVAVVIITLGSRAVWNSEVEGLENTQRSLQLQAAQSNGNASRFHEYENIYSNYSGDWDTLFASLRTYNDNLNLMLGELETILPTTTSVTQIGIADEGLGLQFACQSKEEAAYLIIALRDLQYATLDGISNLTVGPGASAQDMLPSLSAKAAEDAKALAALQSAQQAAANGQEGEVEAPPTTGSSGFDMNSMMQLILQAYSGSGSSNYQDVLQYALDNNLISEDDLIEAISNLSPEELEALEEAYGHPPVTDYTYEELKEHDPAPTFDQRKAAVTAMLSNDQIAQLKFYDLLVNDMSRPAGRKVLFDYIYDDLMDNSELLSSLASSGSISELQEAVPMLVEILVKDETTLAATEKLMTEDETLISRYAYYLAVEMKLQTPIPDVGKIDVDKLWNDILLSLATGSAGGSGGSASDDVVSGLISDIVPSELIDMMNTQNGVSDSDISDILNQITGGQIFPSGATGGEPQVEQDTRIYFSVALGYKPALIAAELVRKGLDYGEKLEILEVEP